MKGDVKKNDIPKNKGIQYLDNTLLKDTSLLLQSVDSRGKLIFVNNLWLKKFGYSKKEAIGMNVWKIISKNSLKHCQKIFSKIMSNKKVICIEAEFICKNGKSVFVKGDISPVISNGEIIFANGIFQDITKEKKIEEKLAEYNENLEKEVKKRTKELSASEKKYRKLYETSKDAIMTLSPPKLEFTAGNLATVKMFGAKNEKEFTSAAPWQLSPKHQPDGQLSGEKAKKMIMKAMKNGSNFFEWTHKKLDGNVFSATVLLSRMKEKNKTYLQATVRDITQQKEYEHKIEDQIEELKELDKLKSKFLTIVSHELKTPLTPAILQLQLLLNGNFGKLDREQEESIIIIQRNINRLNRLINDILEVSQMQSTLFKLNKKEISIENYVREVIEDNKEFAKKKNISLSFSKVKNIPKIFADGGRINQVLSNIIENSIKFTEKGNVSVSLIKDKNYVIIKIKDNGAGIPKKYQSKIFEEFFQVEPMYTRKHGGTGLGLSIAKKIVEEHEGKIELKSEVGKGSVFIIYLPIKKDI
jgi:PAS domain S-box-containing protein